MPTQSSFQQFEFQCFERRKVVAGFDGGAITSNAGALLLRHADEAIGLFERMASCAPDLTINAIPIVHSSRTLVGHRIAAIALSYKDVDD